MKILGLKSSNVKNIKVVELAPDGKSVVLTGKNGVGKSAVLESIELALKGAGSDKGIIRNGADKAQVDLDTGKYKVKRVITKKGERLEVYNDEGAKYPSPQTLLDKLLSKFRDPLEFYSMKPKEQRELIAKMVGLDVSELEEKRLTIYNERTLMNKEVKSCEIKLKDLPAPADPGEEISMQAELDKIEALSKQEEVGKAYLRSQEILQREIVNIEEVMEGNKVIIKEKEKLIEDTKNFIEAYKETNVKVNEAKLKKTKEAMTKMVEPPNVPVGEIDKARESLREIEDKNKAIREAKQQRDNYGEVEAKLKAVKKEADTLTIQLQEIETKKFNRIKNCKFPIPGLSVSDEAVLFEDKKIHLLSDGEQIEVSTAITMAFNPQLKVLLIRAGSMVDSEKLKAIIKKAQTENFQVWIEKVTDDSQIGVHFEEEDSPKEENPKADEEKK